MMFLKQSTASQSVLIGPFIDDTDGASTEPGLTIANTDIRLSKNGANIVSKNSGGGTHDENGLYAITLDATDTNTVGRLQLSVKVTGALSVYHEFWVLEEAIYDALFAASAAGFDASGRVDVGLVLGTAAQAAAGRFQVDVEFWNGSAVATPSVAGVPEVDVTHIVGGTVPAPAVTGVPDVNITHVDDVAGALTALRSVASGTADSGSSTTLVDAALTEGDDDWNGMLLLMTGGSNAGFVRPIADFDAASDTITVFPAFPAAISTDTYEILPGWDYLFAAAAEPTGVPAAAESMWEKINYLFAALRNRITVTATKKQYYDDADSPLWEKDLSDNGTTYDESEGNAP